jgi:hypothetical protein
MSDETQCGAGGGISDKPMEILEAVVVEVESDGE